MKTLKEKLTEEKADLLAMAIEQAEVAQERIKSIVRSLHVHGDHGISFVDAIESLARCQRLLGAMGQNAKVIGIVERDGVAG